ncbi:MAG TPA: DNA repair protein RecO [Xanthomonadales bacterium]|nr:DNA repair protein RecO [Xanthomonadales bacterium]
MSSQAKLELEPGYVLHSRAYRETSLLLEIFSRQQGRVGLVARGARSAKSRWRNMLQPFRPLLLSWKLRGELGNLVEAEQVAAMPMQAGDAWFCGLYVNELMMRALHRGDPHPDLFDAYRQLLQELASQAEPQARLRCFEKQLLESIGFAMALAFEPASGAIVQADRWYRYHPVTGPMLDSAGREANGPGNAARNLVSGAALLALESGEIEAQHLPELKQLMRKVLRFHLGDKPLVSQSLFQ